MITHAFRLRAGQLHGSPAVRSVLVPAALALALTVQSAAAAPARYVFGPLPGEAKQGEAFPVTIQAVDETSQLLEDFADSLRLLAFRPLPEVPVISEVDPQGQVVEVMNPGTTPRILDGWRLEVGRDGPAFITHATLVLPPDSVLAPQSAFVWSAWGTAPGVFPILIHGAAFDQGGNPFNAVRLLDPDGAVIDEVFLSTWGTPVGLRLWHGVGLRPPNPASLVHARSGDANRFQAGDWVTTSEKSPGQPNPQLVLPWTNARKWLPAAPAEVVLSNGVWAGDVSLPLAGDSVVLVADDGAGLQGTSTSILVNPLPTLSLIVPEDWQTASEATPGVLGRATLGLSEPTPTDLTVTLSWSVPDEFSCPSSMVVPAGTDELEFEVSSLDDDWADSDARVELTASAPSHLPASATLRHADDDAGRLHLILPTQLDEGSGLASEPGRVWLEEPARHEVVIELSAGEPLEVTPMVVIPQGRSSASFEIVAGDDSYTTPGYTMVWDALVTARTARWPDSVGSLQVRDNDLPWIHLEAPAEITEGESAEAILRMDAPRRTPFVVRIDTRHESDQQRLGLPMEITVPADVTEYAVLFEPPQNDVADGDSSVALSLYRDGLGGAAGTQVRVRDDDGEFGRMQWDGGLPNAVLSGQPFTLRATLLTPSYQPYHGDLPGTLQLEASPTVAQLAPGTESIQFTDGVWEGEITIFGEALGLDLRVSVGSESLVTYPFDLLSGMDHQLAFADVQWWPGGDCFLVVETPEGEPERLIELAPLTGARGRSLDLPHPANLLALSDDGTTAWLTAPDNSLMSVDLANWQLTRTFPLVPDKPDARAGALLVLSGAPDQVVAAVAPNGWGDPYQLQLYSGGELLPDIVPLKVTGRPLILIRGRTSGEAFCHVWGTIRRCQSTTTGLTVGLQHSLNNTYSLDLTGERLITGDGQTADPETLDATDPYPIPMGWESTGCLTPGRAWFGSIDWNGWIRFFDLNSQEEVASQWTPGIGLPERLVPWGERGLAVVDTRTGKLQVFESPVLQSAAADLEVSIEAPSAVDGSSEQSFVAEITVSNHGPALAPGVELWSDGGSSPVGNIAPGESLTVSVARGRNRLGMTTTRVEVSCPLDDPQPANNVAETTTAFRQEEMAGVRQLFLGMSHLIGSPDQQWLYAALSRDVGGTTNGVAIVDPALGEVVQVLLEPGPVRRLALSDDGGLLYTQWGDGKLTRWNLSNMTEDLTIDLPDQVISDFKPLPGAPASVVIAAGGTIQVFDGDQPRPEAWNGPDLPRRLGFADGRLWAAEQGQLRSFNVTPSGLEADRSTAFSTYNGHLDFSTDGQRLYFMLLAFDIPSFTWLNTAAVVSDPFCAPAEDSLYAANSTGLRRVSTTSFELEAEQPLPRAFDSNLTDLVRWGSGGLTGRRGHQLLILESPLVPAGITADLELTGTPPVDAMPGVPFEWILTISNHSAATSPRNLLIAKWNRLPPGLEVVGAPFDQRGFDFYFYLEEIAGGEEVVIRFRGLSEFSDDWTVSASLLGAGTDPTPDDHTLQLKGRVGTPSADLGIMNVSAPLTVEVGEEFLVSGVLTNAGPDVLGFVRAEVTWGLWDELKVLGCESCGSDPEAPWTVGALPPGGSAPVTIRAVALRPGLHTLSLYGSAERVEPNQANDIIGIPFSCVAASDEPEAPAVVAPAHTEFAWDPVSRQILSINTDYSSGLAVLDPASLTIVSRVVGSGHVDLLAPCHDGEHTWIFGTGGFSRINYQTGVRDMGFETDLPGGIWTMASPAEEPDVLVVAVGDGLIRAYDQGVLRPAAYGPVEYFSRLFFTSDGRLFSSARRQLRELRVDEQGISEVRNLDDLAANDSRPPTEAAGRLFGPDGGVIDIETGVSLGNYGFYQLADQETGLTYVPLSSGSSLKIRSLDARDLEPVWELTFPASGITKALGEEGILTYRNTPTGDRVFQTFSLDVLGPRQTDFELALTLPDTNEGIGSEVPLDIQVANHSPWAAREARLEVTLPEGMEIAPGQPDAGASSTAFEFGTLVDSTNLTLRLLPTAAGTRVVRAVVSSSLPDAAGDEVVAEGAIEVAGFPWLLVDDSDLMDDQGSGRTSIRAWLSRLMPTEISVPFEIVPETATPEDFRTLTGSFVFPPGYQTASVELVTSDTTPEFDELATFQLIPVPAVNLCRTQAFVSIWNDDWPVVQPADASFVERNSGQSDATVTFSLSPKAPWQVEVWFRTLPETAEPNTDFVPREGWLLFDPDENTRTIDIPLIGDRQFERHETVGVSLVEVRGAIPGRVSSLLTIVNDDLPPRPTLDWTAGAEGQISIEISTVLWATYQLEQRTNLVSDAWSAVGEPVSGTGEPAFLPVGTPDLPEAWYRVGVK